MSVAIVDVYIESVSGVRVPLYNCWINGTHFGDIDNKVYSAFQYVF